MIHIHLCEITPVPTNLNIDDVLLAEVLQLSGKKTKREAVNEALSEYIQKRKQKQILTLFGKLDFDPKYDYKKLRQRH
jgi:Arc/MetJ family transcription regulator